jgi:hypothetical protein
VIVSTAPSRRVSTSLIVRAYRRSEENATGQQVASAV